MSLVLVLALFATVRAAFRTHADLALEHLAPRQQLALLRYRSKRTSLVVFRRAFWVWPLAAFDGLARSAQRRSPRSGWTESLMRKYLGQPDRWESVLADGHE